jgi:hypothetical protein
VRLCLLGESLSEQLNGICVLADGECTALYYHIQECDKCEKLRSLDNEQ